MLDLMRRHASSWMIKAVLGAIIVTFIFFFGYSSYRKGGRGGRSGGSGGAALSVNGKPVSTSEFKYFFNRNFEQIKSQFEGGEIPDFVRNMARSTTAQQLVQREIALQQADSLGLVVTDREVADEIRQVISAQQGGEFDPIAYRYDFLPDFRGRTGLDFEAAVREDLRRKALESLFSSVGGTGGADGGVASGALDGEAVRWTFEAVALDPKALVESKSFATEDEVASEAERLLRVEPRRWKGELAKIKVTPQKVGPIGISGRAALFDGKGSLEDLAAAFSLTADDPVLKRPIEAGEKLHIVRLVERKEAGEDELPARVAGGFLNEWLGRLLATAKVRNYIEEQE